MAIQNGIAGELYGLGSNRPTARPDQWVNPAALEYLNQGQGTGTGIGAGVGDGVNAAAENGILGGFMDKFGGLDGLSSLSKIVGNVGGVYAALKGLGLAKDQLNFNKDVYNTNLTNQTKSYNTALEGRAKARYHFEGRPESEADAYVKKHSL